MAKRSVEYCFIVNGKKRQGGASHLSSPPQSGDRRYLYHQGNEQTTGGALRAAARPWFIPAGKYIPADRPQRSTPLQRGAPLQPVREVAAL